MLSILDIIEDTTVDGPGFRTAIYAAGCPNGCPGCHNPESWDINRGRWMSTDEILQKVLADSFADVTFSGGDPMYQPEGFTELAHAIKRQSRKNIWCYTGYTFETLLHNPRQAKLLEYIDVLVDGKFKEELRDEDLYFRGSSNQRLIDVQASLKAKKAVDYVKEDFGGGLRLQPEVITPFTVLYLSLYRHKPIPPLGTMNITVGYRQYQRLVFIVPYVGSRCTKRWYPTYQTLVLPIPAFGTFRTP